MDKLKTLPQTGFLRLPQVLELIPISEANWWDGIKNGIYPKSYKIGRGVTAWRIEDIVAYINSRPQN